MVNFDPSVVKECVFCSPEESIDHVFYIVFRLIKIFQTLEDWFRQLGEVFSPVNFKYVLKYVAAKEKIMYLINFIVGDAKLVDKKAEIKR